MGSQGWIIRLWSRDPVVPPSGTAPLRPMPPQDQEWGTLPINPSPPSSKDVVAPTSAARPQDAQGYEEGLQDLEEAQDVLYCTACATPWAWSKAQAIKAGQIPKPPASQFPKAKGGAQGHSPAIPHSPFVDNPKETAGSNPPFSAPLAKSCFKPEIPQAAFEACDPAYHTFLCSTLLEGGQHKYKVLHELFEKKAAAGDKACRTYMAGYVIGDAAMHSGALAGPPFAPTQAPEVSADAPLRQRLDAAYSAKQAASADVSKAEKAVQAGDKARQQAAQRLADLKAKIAAAEEQQVQAATSCTELRATLEDANKAQALAGQKLEALRVLQEATPVAVAAASAPTPATAPTLAPAKPTQPSASLQQLLAAFNVDNVSAADKQHLEAATSQLGLAGAAARQLLDTMAVLAANSLVAHRQQPDSEEACQYAGTAEQLTAWQQELARSGQPVLAEAVPAAASMEAEEERVPPVKRPAEASTAAAVNVEEDADYRFDYEGPDEAEEEAAKFLLNSEDEKAAKEPTAKVPKTGKKGKKEKDSKTAQESAMDVVAELQQKLSSESPEVVMSDLATAAASSSQSAG